MKKLILLAGAAAMMACDGSRSETMKTLAQVQEISAQKDSLLKDVTATTAFLAELGRQVSTVRNLKAGRNVSGGGTDLEDNMSPDGRRQLLLDKVREITERVNLAENRLAVSRKKVEELSGSDAEKSKQLAAFDSTIVSFREIMESQKAQIASFTEQVQALTVENGVLKAANVQLTSQTAALTTERDSLTTQQNTVYYVVASKKSLMERHVIEKSGGFLGLGVTPVAARDLDKNQFVPIDMTKVNEIPLPRADKAYRVITRQDLAALETPADDHGRVTGALRIRNPEAFWAASKYLILVEQ